MALTNVETALSLGHLLFAAALFLYVRKQRLEAVLCAAFGYLEILLVLFRFSLQNNLNSPLLALSFGTKLLSGLLFYLFARNSKGKAQERSTRYLWWTFVLFLLLAALVDGQARLNAKNPIRKLHTLAWWAIAFLIIFYKDPILLLSLLFWSYVDLFSIGSGIYLTGLMDRQVGLKIFACIVYLLPALLPALLSILSKERLTKPRLQLSLVLLLAPIQMGLHLFGI